MARRRGHGEGAIYQRKDGRWVGCLNIGWHDGRRKRKAVYGRTQKDVQEKLAIVRRKVHDRLPIPSERLTLGGFLQSWLENEARFSVRPSTYVRYRDLLRLHVIPTLGNVKLSVIESKDLMRLYAQKRDEGLSPRTVGHVHRVLHRALEGYPGRSALFQTVKAPSVPASEMKALSPEESRRLLAESENGPLHALYVLALTTGMRQSELLGLKWQDIDLEGSRLSIRRAIRWVSGLGFVEAEPKSASSKRSIVVTPLAISALRRHRTEQAERRLQALVWDDNDLVVSNEVGRPIEATNLIRRSFHPLLEKARLPRAIRFHDLRHTAATLLLGQNVNVKIVSEMLGHSKIAVTLDLYQHVTPNMQQEAARQMEAVLGSR
jgi:integrase